MKSSAALKLRRSSLPASQTGGVWLTAQRTTKHLNRKLIFLFCVGSVAACPFLILHFCSGWCWDEADCLSATCALRCPRTVPAHGASTESHGERRINLEFYKWMYISNFVESPVSWKSLILFQFSFFWCFSVISSCAQRVENRAFWCARCSLEGMLFITARITVLWLGLALLAHMKTPSKMIQSQRPRHHWATIYHHMSPHSWGSCSV